jgi:hypothetical protein
MTGDDLTREQIEPIKAVVGRQPRYLMLLTTRMDRVGWSPTDPVYRAAFEAHHAVHALNVQLHYASLPPGAASKSQPPPKDADGP